MTTNSDIADLFDRIADMLSIRGDNFHRILAYRNGAESIRALGRDVKVIAADGELTEIPGIGSTLATKIEEILQTGTLEFYQRLALDVPPQLVDLLRVEGLGPKRVRAINAELGILTLDELKVAATDGALRSLPGMGAKTEQNIIDAIERLERHGDDRTPLWIAWSIAHEILDELAGLPGVAQASVGGSLRRMRETVGDIDLLIASSDPEPVMKRFANLPQIETVVVGGPTKTTVQLVNGMQVDLRVLAPERWGTLLSYFTGSKEHNVRLRELALQRGMSLNEHAFRPVVDGVVTDQGEVLCASEEEVYGFLGLPYIPPTLREDKGEIKAAQNGALPDLIEESALRADLHMHTTWSDGKLSVLEMARAARARGHEFIVITDHSQSLGIANGLTPERLRQQRRAIDEANDAIGPDFRILHGAEVEIRADGSLDYSDEVLAELDFVIASLHVSLSQPRDRVTDRALAAIDSPHVDMLAHPTGRLLPDRPGADLDMERVFFAALRSGTILEVNANPARLDLRDSHVRRAVELGVKIAVNTDAHRAEELDLLHYGVATAQRGWARASDVVNTWPLQRFLDFIAT